MAITLKTPEDIEHMRVAGRLAAEVLQVVAPHVKPGVTTEELDRICHDHIVNVQGAIPANIGYRGFPKTVCTSVNNVICHGIPAESKVLKDGDIVNIDVTVIKDGWHGDTSRMYYVGTPSVMARRLVETTREAMFRGIRAVKPGATLGDVGHAIQQYAEAERFSVVREYCGHGIGKVYHDEPQVLHYGRTGEGVVLKPGMTFTIEPMINEGTRHTRLLPDGWTVVTKDRKLSAQWEHTVVVTDDGVEILTRLPGDDNDLWTVPAASAAAPASGGPNAVTAATPAALRERLQRADEALAARFDAGEDIDRLVRARTATLDAAVRDAWNNCVGGAPGLALFAVGGYGRGELFPQSDIDLLVLAEPEAQACHADALAAFVAQLWDAGMPLGHAVRSLQQTTQAARDDVTVMTSLLEARLLEGDPATIDALAEAVAPGQVWSQHAFFEAKREEQRQRHARFGDTSDNLEPNLKEGPGGLRDLHTLRWLAMRVAGTRDMESLIALGQLGADEFATLDRERRELSRLRFGLHLVAGRREERLRFDHQKLLAARLGHVDNADNLAVEQMMQVFYRSAARVQRISDRLLQRFEEQLEGEADPVPVDARFELRRGYLAARDPSWPQPGTAAMMDEVFALFAAWAGDAGIRGLHSRTARALAEALKLVPAYPAASAPQRAAFMALLRGPRPVRTLERMARLGVLGRWLPAFARVSGRMQFDLFHVYTVDQHTLAVLRNVAGFASGDPDERFSIADDVWPRLHKPEMLLLAALFHDIAKGRGGDHSTLGAVDAREFCAAHGLSEADTALVAWLVEQHLLMSTTAQKQDIADPEVIHRFADKVGDRDRLDYLYLLTCADIAGTSPRLWNAWKDRLLADLYVATRRAYRRGLENPLAAAERIAETRSAAQALLEAQCVAAHDAAALLQRMPQQALLRARSEQIAWQAAALRDTAAGATRVLARQLGTGSQGHALEVFVHSPDRDGLFAAIVATLDRLGLVVERARIFDGPGGTIFDTFEVIPSDHARPVLPADLERKLLAVLAAPLDRVRPTRRTQPRHLRHFRIVPQVSFDANDAGRSVLGLVCTDRPGLLADIAQVLRAQHLRVHDARIATFGERAEDVFQITDERDQPLDAERQQALRDALKATLDGEVPR